MGPVEIERLLGLPQDQLAFHRWYLRDGLDPAARHRPPRDHAEGVDEVERHRVRLGAAHLIESRVADTDDTPAGTPS